MRFSCRHLEDTKDARRTAIERWDAIVAKDLADTLADRERQAKERAFKQSPEGRRKQAEAFRKESERQSNNDAGGTPTRRSRISILNPVRSDGGRRGSRPPVTPDAQLSVPALKAAEIAANPGAPPGACKAFPVNLNEVLVHSDQLPADTSGIAAGARP